MAIKQVKVVVFSPPPVPEGEPPIVIIAMTISKEHGASCVMGIILNPAVVIEVIDTNSAVEASNPGFVKRITKVPPSKMASVDKIIIFVV